MAHHESDLFIGSLFLLFILKKGGLLLIIRPYVSSDCSQMAQLFYDTVHTINRKDYTKEQCNAWATGQIDLAAWDNSFLAHHTLVAVEDDKIVGFGDIDSTGYLDRLYIHKDYQNRGIASALCQQLEQAFSVPKISVYASITARPFFEKMGYITQYQNQVERNGVRLYNYFMEKTL